MNDEKITLEQVKKDFGDFHDGILKLIKKYNLGKYADLPNDVLALKLLSCFLGAVKKHVKKIKAPTLTEIIDMVFDEIDDKANC